MKYALSLHCRKVDWLCAQFKTSRAQAIAVGKELQILDIIERVGGNDRTFSDSSARFSLHAERLLASHSDSSPSASNHGSRSTSNSESHTDNATNSHHVDKDVGNKQLAGEFASKCFVHLSAKLDNFSQIHSFAFDSRPHC